MPSGFPGSGTRARGGLAGIQAPVAMYDPESLSVDLDGIAGGGKPLAINLDDGFFEAVGDGGILGGNVAVTIGVSGGDGSYDLRFHYEGRLFVACDVCLERVELPVCADDRMLARRGEAPGDAGDCDVIALGPGREPVDLSWTLYEFLALLVPLRCVHAEGGCDSGMLEILGRMSVGDADGRPLGESARMELGKLENDND